MFMNIQFSPIKLSKIFLYEQLNSTYEFNRKYLNILGIIISKVTHEMHLSPNKKRFDKNFYCYLNTETIN